MLPKVIAAQLKRQLESLLLDQTCTITHQTETVDEYGARTQVWVTIASDVPCRVIRAQNRRFLGQDEVAMQEVMVESYRLITPVGTPLDVDYRITLPSGSMYEVVQVLDANTNALDAQAEMVRRR